MATDLYYHWPSSYTLHKARLLLVHIFWQEGWAGASSPCPASLLGPAMAAGFPPETIQMPFCWNSMGHKLSKGRPQDCWTSGGSICPSLVRSSQDRSSEDKDKIMLLSARLGLFLRECNTRPSLRDACQAHTYSWPNHAIVDSTGWSNLNSCGGQKSPSCLPHHGLHPASPSPATAVTAKDSLKTIHTPATRHWHRLWPDGACNAG